jgi:hypothetical protein
MLMAVDAARARIAATPLAGMPAPRPYPNLKKPGRLWLKSGRYWISYSSRPLVIIGIFFETVDIPRHVS